MQHLAHTHTCRSRQPGRRVGHVIQHAAAAKALHAHSITAAAAEAHDVEWREWCVGGRLQCNCISVQLLRLGERGCSEGRLRRVESHMSCRQRRSRSRQHLRAAGTRIRGIDQQRRPVAAAAASGVPVAPASGACSS